MLERCRHVQWLDVSTQAWPRAFVGKPLSEASGLCWEFADFDKSVPLIAHASPRCSPSAAACLSLLTPGIGEKQQLFDLAQQTPKNLRTPEIGESWFSFDLVLSVVRRLPSKIGESSVPMFRVWSSPTPCQQEMPWRALGWLP